MGRILEGNGIHPAPVRGQSPNWAEFLQSRRVEIGGIRRSPDGGWMQQIGRNLTDPFSGFLRVARLLIHDRDPLFTRDFRRLLQDSGVEPIRLPAKSPNLNAHAERFIRSIRQECLNRTIPLGERHLRQLVHEYVAHYNAERNHQGIRKSRAKPNRRTRQQR